MRMRWVMLAVVSRYEKAYAACMEGRGYQVR